MKLWQYGAFCSLLIWGLGAEILAQDGFTVPIGGSAGLKIKAPARGAFHSAFVDTQDNVPSRADLLDRVHSYENQSGLKLQMVTIQSNWKNGFEFPLQAVQELYDAGYLTQVRLMPGLDSRPHTGKIDPIFDLKKIAKGEFDAPLMKMLQSIAALKGKDGEAIPLMISFAPEPNGGRYRHSGYLYGAGETAQWGDPSLPDGPEIYRDAYRHLIDLSRRAEVNAGNITWALHLESEARPYESWNVMKHYYPGDDYIDWLGLSVLGAQEQGELSEYRQFQDVLYGESLQSQNRWMEFTSISDRPYKGLFKFAVIEDPSQSCRKADWLSRTLKAIPSEFQPFKLVNYWSESVNQDPGRSLRLDTSKCAVDAYKNEIAAGFFQGKLRIQKPGMPPIPSEPTPSNPVPSDPGPSQPVPPPSIENVPQFATLYGCDLDVRSYDGPTRRQATFQGSYNFEVYWINARGEWVFMGRGSPRRPLVVNTTAGHAFSITVNGKCAGKVKIGLNNNIFQVG
jgi:hypothetical protein